MSEPIRVLQVFASLNIGGAECRMMDVYRHINKQKIQFDFITMTTGDQYFEKEIKTLGGRIFKIANPRENGIISNIKSLVSIMKMHDYIAVHAHTSYHCGIVLLAAKIAGVNIRVSHARTTGTIQKGLITKINIYFGKLLIRFFSTDKLCISKDAGIFLYGEKAVKNQQVIVLSNAIDLKEYENISCHDLKLKEKLTGSIVVGHIGRFSKMKNQNFLVDIFKELVDEERAFKLVFVGEGPLKEEVTRKVYNLNLSDSVIFTGGRRDIPFLMSMIDVFVMPSTYEGLGGVVIEAQAAGVPSVVSEVLPSEIDLGLGIIKRVSLDAPIQEWISAIKLSLNLRIKDRVLIRKKFEDKNYTIEQEVNYLLKFVYRL